MPEQMILKIDGASFRKLIVPAHVAYKANKDVYTNLLIVKHGNNIISYGTDLYSCYRVNIELDKVNAEASEDSSASEKVFNFVLFDRMIKHIKTAVTSRIERKNLAILCTRSGDRHADIFSYNEWFAALIMPTRR